MYEDILQADINLGVDYFQEHQREEMLNEWGFQAGLRVRTRFWRIENFLQLSIYQNLEVGPGRIDLSGTEIVCNNFDEVLSGGDLMCAVPPSDPEEEPPANEFVTWQTTGFLITERLFVNLYEDDNNGRVGPEIEIRLEKPL